VTPEQYAKVKDAAKWCAHNAWPVGRGRWGVIVDEDDGPIAWKKIAFGQCCPLGALLLREGKVPIRAELVHYQQETLRNVCLEAILGEGTSTTRIGAFLCGFDGNIAAHLEADECPPSLKAWYEAGKRMWTELVEEGTIQA
jgi:hypothetical protein